MPSFLTLGIIKYESRVKRNNPGKGVRLPLHLSVIANEKGAFESPSTKVTNFIYFFNILNTYMYKQDMTLNNLQTFICHKTQLTITIV